MGNNPSEFKGEKRPVENVSWYDAVKFCQKLSQKTGKTYHLLSEAQWEYACRAGTTSPFYFGDTIRQDLVNYDPNYSYGSGGSTPKGVYRQQTTDVRCFPPNAFGLYDMHGNVWEWCAWHANYQGALSEGRVWDYINNDNSYQMLRGGSWFNKPRNCRSAIRFYRPPDHSNGAFGFRVVCVAAWVP